MEATERMRFVAVEGADEVLTRPFMEYMLAIHDKFNARIHEFRSKRAQVLDRALKEHKLPTYPPASEATTGDWQVPPVPEDLMTPGIEISGPASITNMVINALNPGSDGTRAEGYLDDDEDAGGHRLIDTVAATRNRLAAVNLTLTYHDTRKNRKYKILPGKLPFFMHRERGLQLDEPEVTIDNKPVSAALLGMALTLFHAGRAQIERGQGVYWYLPKLESAEECAFWREFFDFSRDYLRLPKSAVIRAIPLMESLPLAYQMEEALYALGPYAAGLNAARWDFKASIFEFVMTDPNSVWPDRFGVDIKTTEFLATIFRRLVAICLKRGAAPIGGMATALPSKDKEINKVAAASIRVDKEWEAQQGFFRGWVAHIFHMQTAAIPFKNLWSSGWKPTPDMADPEKYPIEITVPAGPVTIEGTRQNARMIIEYVEGWLNGRGAKGIDSLENKPGIHPALMEDLATGRMSVAQIAQRVLHSAKDSVTGEAHDFPLIKRILQEELESILVYRTREAKEAGVDAHIIISGEERYRKALKITIAWIKKYTDLDFRSLGSYTRSELEIIATSSDAF